MRYRTQAVRYCKLRRTAPDQVVSRSRQRMPSAAWGLSALRASALSAESQRLRRQCIVQDLGCTNDASGGDGGWP